MRQSFRKRLEALEKAKRVCHRLHIALTKDDLEQLCNVTSCNKAIINFISEPKIILK